MCEVGRVFPKHVQGTYLTGESPLGRPRVAHTLHLYNYLLKFHLTLMPSIRFLVFKHRALLILTIISLSEIMPLYSRCVKKELLYITIAAPSSH